MVSGFFAPISFSVRNVGCGSRIPTNNLSGCGTQNRLNAAVATTDFDRGPFPFSLHPPPAAVESKAGYSL